MAGVLGRALVQVFADLSKFTPGLRQEIKKALDEQTKGLRFEELDKSAEKAGESAADELAKGVDSKIENNMEKEGKKGGNSFGKGLKAALGVAVGLFMPTLIALGVELVAALAPAALALSATIPAAVGLAVGALATLKLATNGVGAALKTAFDPSKAAQFNEAMKKLAPAARSFVLEIKNLHPAFHQLQQDVQQTFFVQLQGVLTRVSRTLLPALRTGLGQLSADLGKMGANLLRAFGNGREDLASIFISAHEALKPFIPVLGQVAGAFLTIGAVAGPLFASLSGGFAKLLANFSQFISEAADSGALAKFFDDALVILKQLGGFLGNVFDLVTAILSALQADGAQALGFLSDLVGQLAAFFATAQGKDLLAQLFLLLNTALSTMQQVLTPLLPAIGQLVAVFAGGLTTALVKITPLLVSIADVLAKHPDLLEAAAAAWMVYRAALVAVAIYEAIVDALNPVGWIVLAIAAIAAGAYLIYKNWDAVTRALKSAWGAISDFFSSIWQWILTVGKDIANWFTVTLPGFFASIPGRIWAALSALPGLLGQLFMNALHDAGVAIGIGVGLILAIFLKTPGLIWDALKSIGHLFADLWHLALSTGETVLRGGIATVVFIFTQLPGRIAGFVNRLPGIIGGAFRSAWDWAKREVREGADSIVGFVQRLPGRVSGFMRNVGRDILGGLRSGINAVIGGFNSGIDRVSGAIHIGLPHLPMLASGGLISSPTLAVVGEAGPEAVVPLSDPSKAAAVARKTGLLDILGSRMGNTGATLVKVYLGTREITDILNVQIDKKMNDQANELAYGTR
jgi:phage-related protein